MLPAREMPLDADGVRVFRRRFRARFEGEPTQAGIYRGVSEGLAPAGIEFYLPLFFEHTATLFDYLPQQCDRGDAMRRSRVRWQHNWQDIQARYEERRHDIERPVLAPAGDLPRPRRSAGTAGALCAASNSTVSRRDLESAPARAGVHNFPTAAPRELRIDTHAAQPFAALESFRLRYSRAAC